MREALGKAACWIDGNVTPFGLYHALYTHRNSPVVIDDVDCLYANRTSVRLLKSLCQTELRKRVAWHSCTTTLGHHGIPKRFDTSSGLVIIANEWKTLNPNVSAIENHGHVVFFDPTPIEVHVRTARWFWDQEVYDFVGEHLHLAGPLSMRDYRLSWELKEAGLDWRVAREMGSTSHDNMSPRLLSRMARSPAPINHNPHGSGIVVSRTHGPAKYDLVTSCG